MGQRAGNGIAIIGILSPGVSEGFREYQRGSGYKTGFRVHNPDIESGLVVNAREQAREG